MTAFYAVLRGYQTQGVFCEVVSRVLQMVFYKAYKGHNIAYFFWVFYRELHKALYKGWYKA